MNPLSARSMVLALVAGLVALVGGCEPDYQVDAVRQFLQEPRQLVAGERYEVMPPDVISITSSTVEEINGYSSVIRPDGMINLPLLGEVFVAGKSPSEIEGELKQAAGTYYERVPWPPPRSPTWPGPSASGS